jgi:hypothetical protein
MNGLQVPDFYPFLTSLRESYKAIRRSWVKAVTRGLCTGYRRGLPT